MLTAAGARPQAEVFGMLHGQRLGTSPEPYLLVVLDLVLGAVGGWEARLLPRQGDALLLDFIRADVGDRSWRWKNGEEKRVMAEAEHPQHPPRSTACLPGDTTVPSLGCLLGTAKLITAMRRAQVRGDFIVFLMFMASSFLLLSSVVTVKTSII